MKIIIITVIICLNYNTFKFYYFLTILCNVYSLLKIKYLTEQYINFWYFNVILIFEAIIYMQKHCV